MRIARPACWLGLALAACNAESTSAPPPPPTEQGSFSPVPFEEEPATPEAECLVPAIGTTRARLLTRFEYDNTVRDLLGDTTQPARNFPPENRILAFDNDGRTHIVSPLLVEQYQTAAEEIAQRAVANHLSMILPCAPTESGCGAQFVDTLLPRAFRGPVTDADAAPYHQLFQHGVSVSGFNTGVGMVLEAVLQSPRFLYRIESATPGDELAPATSYELASRLSYFLWGSMPDDELRNAPLETPEEIQAQARRLFADPRSHDAVAHFFMQWLDLEGLDSLPKDTNAYPQFTDQVRASWMWSMQRYIEHVVFERGTMEALLTEPIVYVDDVLRPIYGAQADPLERAGLLTQPALMAKLAHPDQSSPIRRGVFVRERILCELLPSPPNNVDTTPPDPDPNATTRERFAEHTSNATCRGCHQLIDPLGFGFEHYDGIGRFRATENDIPIDASGEVVAPREAAIAGTFDGAIELSNRLATSDEVRRCLVTQLFRYAMGRAEENEDACTIEKLDNALVAADGRLDELWIKTTLSPAFRMKREEDAQ